MTDPERCRLCGAEHPAWSEVERVAREADANARLMGGRFVLDPENLARFAPDRRVGGEV